MAGFRRNPVREQKNQEHQEGHDTQRLGDKVFGSPPQGFQIPLDGNGHGRDSLPSERPGLPGTVPPGYALPQGRAKHSHLPACR